MPVPWTARFQGAGFSDIVMDAREKGHWGTGDLECSLHTMDELERVKPLLERAYLEN